MRLKNCLFFLSLVFVFGCSFGHEQEITALQGKIDSLSASHAALVDSLTLTITNQQEVIEGMYGENEAMLDSLERLAKEKGTSSGPAEKHPRGEPWRPGDPIPDFRKK